MNHTFTTAAVANFFATSLLEGGIRVPADKSSLRHLGVITLILIPILLCLIISIWGCSTIDPMPPPKSDIRCTTDIKTYNVDNSPLTVTVLQPEPMCTKIINKLWSQPGAKFLYCDKAPWVIPSIESEIEILKGSYLIQTCYADRDLSSEEYLTFRVNGDLDAIYVAYDPRATRKPDWLLNQFFPVINQTTSYPIGLPTTLPDKSQQSSSQFPPKVRLELWKMKPDVLTQFQYGFGANSSEGAKWPTAFPADNKAMYVVFVKPKEVQQPQGKVYTKIYYDTCIEGWDKEQHLLKIAEAEAMKDALEKFPPLGSNALKADHLTTNCQKIGPCSGKVGSTSHPLSGTQHSFLHHSEVIFKQSISTAVVQIKGNSYTLPIRGNLHFEYEFDPTLIMQIMRINSLTLLTDNKVEDYGNITISLVKPLRAQCKSSPAPVANPCDDYEIGSGSLITDIGMSKENKWWVFAANNDKPIMVKINHATRSFRIQGGPLTTSIEIDGEKILVTVKIDLTGEFYNFAPKATTIESQTACECDENMNAVFLTLDASGSFDIYSKLPPHSYEWYEDWGLVTEKFWGNTSKVIIWPHQLDFGVHDFILIVRDGTGVADTSNVKLRVFDSKPPTLILPPDVYAISLDKKPMQLKIGQASATDICSGGQVLVSNNAPANLTFPPGKTEIIWEADDGRGNLTKAAQNIYIFVPIDELSEMREIFTHLSTGLEHIMNSIDECRSDNLMCALNLEGLLKVIDQLTSFVQKLSSQKEMKRDAIKIVDRLRRITDHLNTSQSLLNQAGKSQEERLRSQLRAEAMIQLENAYSLVKEFRGKKY